MLNANFNLKQLGANKILVCYFEHIYGFSIYMVLMKIGKKLKIQI